MSEKMFLTECVNKEIDKDRGENGMKASVEDESFF
jgi:hypothetical protein